jgi:hypothetical protein
MTETVLDGLDPSLSTGSEAGQLIRLIYIDLGDDKLILIKLRCI